MTFMVVQFFIMQKLLIMAITISMSLSCHRRVNVVNRILNSFKHPSGRPMNGSGHLFRYRLNHNWNHRRHLNSLPRHAPVYHHRFRDKHFNLPFMHKFKKRFELAETLMNNHDKVNSMQNEFLEINNNVQTLNSNLEEIFKLPETFKSLEQHEEKLGNMIKGFKNNVMISHIQNQSVDPDIENVVDRIMENFSSPVLPDDKKDDLKGLLNELSSGKETLNSHMASVSKHYNSLTEALNDLPNLFQSLWDKVNHIDENHQNDQISSTSPDEKTVAEIEKELSKIEQLSDHFKDDAVENLEKKNKKAFELHNKQHENLNKIKVIEDGVNDVQEKKADMAKKMLNELESKPNNNAKNLKSTMDILQDLAAVAE